MLSFLTRALCGALLSLTLSLAASAEPVLVGHPALAGQTLEADAVKAVLLGKRVTLGDTRVVMVIVKTSEAQDKYLSSAVGMNTSQFQNHWKRLFMTGNGSSPKVVDSDAAAARVVADTAGAIAIVDTAAAGALPVLAQ